MSRCERGLARNVPLERHDVLDERWVLQIGAEIVAYSVWPSEPLCEFPLFVRPLRLGCRRQSLGVSSLHTSENSDESDGDKSGEAHECSYCLSAPFSAARS